MTRVVLASALGGLFAVASASVPATDPQAFVTLAAGRDVLAGGPAGVDTHSWTALGAPLVPEEWLGELLFALAYEAGGWKGVVLLRALAGGAVVALTAFAALRERVHPLVGLLATLPAALMLPGVSIERPQLLALVLFAAFLALLRSAAAGPRAMWWSGVPVFLVWANLHTSYLLGLGVFAVVALGVRRREALVGLAASAAATLVTPAGAGLIGVAAGRFLAPPRSIAEAAVPDLVTPTGLVLALTLALVLAVALLGRASGREALILVPVTFISLSAAGNAVLLAIAAAPFLAANAPAALGSLATGVGIRLPELAPARRSRAIGRVALAVALLSAASAAVLAPAAPDLRAYPQAAVSALRPGPGLFNELDWGGFLRWHAPATKVFVEGRPWPGVPAVIADHTTILEAHPGWRETIARRGVRQLLVRATAGVAVRARELGWRESATGAGFVLFEVPP